ncbi:hypothetical protein E6B08_08145 [Pseudomonas putida]|uniref:Uncharacterized protein n=1 Tax=Pseudomonas putida TaxID=303 RepID=A0A4D6X5R8_PSEPU|nr:hypothetical protein [Pseudomonas putida]QCI11369.1 hypothetical protein E6B08_08145 [Pseudomonas putida]
MASKLRDTTRPNQQAAAYPAPDIPLRNEYGEIDVEALKDAPLEMVIKGDHIKFGNEVYPVWRGAAVDGEPFDELNAVVEVPVDYDPDVGITAYVSNRYVKPYQGGSAFLSYKVDGMDENTPDSERVFCYLGLRERGGFETLAVAQARESHDRVIVTTDLATEGVSLLAPRYQAIQIGDSVELLMKGFNASGDPVPEHSEVHAVTAANLAEPLQWQVAKSHFMRVRGGRAEFHYEVTLAGVGGTLTSPVQTFAVDSASAPADRLAVAEIDGSTGAPLDPGMFPDGVTVRVPVYPGIQPGDFLLLYWHSPGQPQPVAQFARMDVSCLETNEIVLHVSADLLVQGEHNVIYQFARTGDALTSEPLRVEFEAPRALAAPAIERATEDGPGRQQLAAGDALLGAYVTVPDVELRPGENFEVHWWGYEKGGRQVTDTPETAGGRRFKIDPGVVAANMHQPLDTEGRRFEVFYHIVDEHGVRSQPSAAVNLRVVPVSLGSTINCREADAVGDLPQSRLGPNGALLAVTGGTGLWAFAAQGQPFTIAVENIAVLRDATPITAMELRAVRVEQWLSRAVYDQMEDNKQHTVSGTVSFDQGDSWHALTPLRLTPKKST